jgi:hypothetical protein
MPDGEEILRFHYKVILLWKIPYEDLLNTGLRGLYPFVPLARGGAKRKVIEEIIGRLMAAHDTITRELLSITGLFASLALKRRSGVVREEICYVR